MVIKFSKYFRLTHTTISRCALKSSSNRSTLLPEVNIERIVDFRKEVTRNSSKTLTQIVEFRNSRVKSNIS